MRLTSCREMCTRLLAVAERSLSEGFVQKVTRAGMGPLVDPVRGSPAANIAMPLCHSQATSSSSCVLTSIMALLDSA